MEKFKYYGCNCVLTSCFERESVCWCVLRDDNVSGRGGCLLARQSNLFIICGINRSDWQLTNLYPLQNILTSQDTITAGEGSLFICGINRLDWRLTN